MTVPRRRGGHTRVTTALLALGIALLAAGVAGRGMGDIPLESHEIYVAQTAENMLDSGDWLVPRLNGAYRLTKPPLSYWAVAGAAWLAGEETVSPALARLPSVLAAAGLALLVFWIGARLFDWRTGGLGALMSLSCLALFKYGHNARPDMLYAFWTTAVFAAWVGARRARRPASEHGWIISLWVLFGLATLTKGPQAPLILIAGLVLHGILAGEGARSLFKTLRPIRGLLIVLAITLPWWLALRAAVGPQTLSGSQLSGGLLTINPLRLATPYYLVHGPILWLPWSLLLPCAAVAVWRDWRGNAGLLAVTVGSAMVAFALGPQYRQIYLLPWLAPAMLVLAAGITRTTATRRWLWLPWAAGTGALIWLIWHNTVAAWVLALVGGTLLALAVRALLTQRAVVAAALIAVAGGVALAIGGAVPALWSEARYEQLAFSRALASRIDSDMPIVVWDIDPVHYAYYLGRPVVGFETLENVCGWLESQTEPSLLIYPAERRESLRGVLPLTPVLTAHQSGFAASRLPAQQDCRGAPNKAPRAAGGALSSNSSA